MPFISSSLWDFWSVVDLEVHWWHKHEAIKNQTALEYKEA